MNRLPPLAGWSFLFGLQCGATSLGLAVEPPPETPRSTPVAEATLAKPKHREALRFILDQIPSELSAVPTPVSGAFSQEPTEEFFLKELSLTYAATAPTSTSLSAPSLDGVLKLEPVLVGVERISNPMLPSETRFDHFVRTGTIAEHVGQRVTTRFWMRGDKGVMISFSW